MQSIAKASEDKNTIEKYERVKQRRKWKQEKSWEELSRVIGRWSVGLVHFGFCSNELFQYEYETY